MAFLPALGAFGTGYQQGEDHAQQIRSRAQQIQQAQMALDTAKKDVAAQAAAFANLPGAQAFGGPQGAPSSAQPPMQFPGQQMAPPPGPPPTAQPMPPGQASQPAVPQSPASASTPPTGGAVTAPSAAPPMAAAGGGSLPQQGQGQIDPTDPRAAVQTVMSIAQEIKQRNPGIDPQTLMLATSRIIDMSKGLAPALRQGAQVVLQDMRDQAAQGRVETQVAGRQDVASQNIGSREKIAGQRDETTRRGQDIGLQRTREQAQAAMQRAQAVQGAITQRFASGQGNQAQKAAMTERGRAIAAQLTAATRQLALLKDAAGQPLPDTDPRVQKAAKDIAAASAKLDILEKAAIGGQAAPAPGAGNAGGAQPLTATDAKGNKLQWNGQVWAPVGK